MTICSFSCPLLTGCIHISVFSPPLSFTHHTAPPSSSQHFPDATDGRMEDGYLAWSSIYLHENFGFTIYMPLTAEEEELMKANKYIPKWMYEFTSLPNIAIPLSYFCIGVALQLLRTPLIVYFIQDQGASAAEVNVLFTVSK